MKHSSQYPASFAALAAVAVALAGCQTFQPAEPSGLRSGQTVRVELADSVERAEAGWAGPEAERLTGEVVSVSPDGMTLSVRSRIGGASLSPYRDTLRVPSTVVRSVQRQQMSVLRSAAVAGGVVATAALLVEINAAGGGSSPQPGGGGGVESIGISIPVIP